MIRYPRVWLVSLLVTASGTLQYGYSVSVFNIPIYYLEEFVNESRYSQTGQSFTDQRLVSFWSMTASLLSAGMLICAILFARPSLIYLGRKKSLCLMALLFIVGNIIQALSFVTNRYQLLPAGKIVSGMGCALGCIVGAIFLTEIAPNSIRGTVGSLNHVMFELGTLLANLLALGLGTADLWPWLLVFPLIFPLMLLIAMPFIPDSPKYIYAHLTKKPHNRAKAKIATEVSLRWYHGLHADIDSLEEAVERETRMGEMSFWQVLNTASYRKMLLLVLAIGIGDSFNGTFVFTSFIKDIVDSLGFDWDAGTFMSFLFPATDLIAGLPSMYLVEKWGRRPLLLIGYWGVTVTLSIMFLSQIAAAYSGVQKVGYLTLAAILGHVIVRTVGSSKVVWQLDTELFATQARPAVSSFRSATIELCNMVTTYAFLPMWHARGAWVFLILIVPMAGASSYCTYACPETTQRNIADIIEELHGTEEVRQENVPLLSSEEGD